MPGVHRNPEAGPEDNRSLGRVIGKMRDGDRASELLPSIAKGYAASSNSLISATCFFVTGREVASLALHCGQKLTWKFSSSLHPKPIRTAPHVEQVGGLATIFPTSAGPVPPVDSSFPPAETI